MWTNPHKAIQRQIRDAYDVNDFLNSKERIRAWCEFWFSGKIFISHTAPDSQWCEKNIVSPIKEKFGQERWYGEEVYFFLSRASPDWHRKLHFALVENSFRYAKTVLIVISRNSRQSNWMSFEARWAIQQRHPIIICLRDDIDPSFLRRELRSDQSTYYYAEDVPVAVINFGRELSSASEQLLSTLETPPFKPEFRSIPFGTSPRLAFEEFFKNTSQARHKRGVANAFMRVLRQLFFSLGAKKL